MLQWQSHGNNALCTNHDLDVDVSELFTKILSDRHLQGELQQTTVRCHLQKSVIVDFYLFLTAQTNIMENSFVGLVTNLGHFDLISQHK